MSSVITCECGAAVRMPEKTGNRSFRCPKCKNGTALSVDARVLSTTRLAPGDPDVTCPICQSTIAEEEVAVTCPQCDQVHHRECWSEVGGCGTYGCEQAPALDKSDASAQTPLSAWGDTKTCPVCAESIKAIALRCRYCGTDFDTVDPLNIKDLHRRADKEETASTMKKTVVVLFVLSIIGCLAPLIAIVAMVMILPKRHMLAKEGPVFVVLGYSSIILSVVYSFLMLMFVISEAL